MANSEKLKKILNNLNLEANKERIGDQVVDGFDEIKSTIADQTFAGENASITEAGLMSAADKIKLDAIEDQANKYVLPDATDAAIGGVKQGVAVVDSAEATSPTTAEFNALLASLRAAGVIAS